MDKTTLVFQVDSAIVQRAYSELQNYLIECAEIEPEEDKYCIIYFSSNDIYYPNNEATFTTQILNKNRFEWFNCRINKGSKHIFLRDIFKQWYLKGINRDINSIEKLLEFLKKETAGYRVITLGSSSGGYAAVLFGSALNAELVYTFNGQFMLSDLLSSSSKKKSSELLDPVIYREQHNPPINQYYSLRPYIKNPERIHYFYSLHSAWDMDQFAHISDMSLQFIPFKTSHHGVPFLKTNLPKVLNQPTAKLQKYKGKINYPLLFSIRIDGLIQTIKNLVSILWDFAKRKISRLLFK